MRRGIPCCTVRGWDPSRRVASIGQREFQIQADSARAETATAEPVQWKSCLIPLRLRVTCVTIEQSNHRGCTIALDGYAPGPDFDHDSLRGPDLPHPSYGVTTGHWHIPGVRDIAFDRTQSSVSTLESYSTPSTHNPTTGGPTSLGRSSRWHNVGVERPTVPP